MGKRLFWLFLLLVFLVLAGCTTTSSGTAPTASPTTQVPGHQDFIKETTRPHCL